MTGPRHYQSRFCRGCAKHYPLGWARCPKCDEQTTISVNAPNVTRRQSHQLDYQRRDRERLDPERPIDSDEDFSPEMRGFFDAWDERRRVQRQVSELERLWEAA